MTVTHLPVDPRQTAAGIVLGVLESADEDDFPRAVCRVVHENLPAFRVSLAEVRLRAPGYRATCWPPLPPGEEPRLTRVVGRHLGQHPALRAHARGRSLPSVVSWHDLDPGGKFPGTELYRRFYAPDGITDQLCLRLPGPAGLEIGMTLDRAGGMFTATESEALRRAQPALDAVFTRLHDSRLPAVLGSLGWAHVVTEPTGEIVLTSDRALALLGECGLDLGVGRSLADQSWWPRIAGMLAGARTLTGRAEPELGSVRVGPLRVLVERPLVGHPRVYLHDGAGEHAAADVLVTEALTPRQREVAQLLLEGLSARQISQRLGISMATARSHIENLYKRLGVRNRAQVVSLLIGRGASA